jgi:hypothetical protein
LAGCPILESLFDSRVGDNESLHRPVLLHVPTLAFEAEDSIQFDRQASISKNNLDGIYYFVGI